MIYFVDLPGGKELAVLSPGQRFMTDLLVSSLMADGGLENALDIAFRKETSKVEEKLQVVKIIQSTTLVGKLSLKVGLKNEISKLRDELRVIVVMEVETPSYNTGEKH